MDTNVVFEVRMVSSLAFLHASQVTLDKLSSLSLGFLKHKIGKNDGPSLLHLCHWDDEKR